MRVEQPQHGQGDLGVLLGLQTRGLDLSNRVTFPPDQLGELREGAGFTWLELKSQQHISPVQVCSELSWAQPPVPCPLPLQPQAAVTPRFVPPLLLRGHGWGCKSSPTPGSVWDTCGVRLQHRPPSALLLKFRFFYLMYLVFIHRKYTYLHPHPLHVPLGGSGLF